RVDVESHRSRGSQLIAGGGGVGEVAIDDDRVQRAERAIAIGGVDDGVRPDGQRAAADGIVAVYIEGAGIELSPAGIRVVVGDGQCAGAALNEAGRPDDAPAAA